MNSINKLVVLTGGGDAPGMNAALRAVSRIAIGRDWAVWGVKNGFHGLQELAGATDLDEPRAQDRLKQIKLGTMRWAIREGGSWLGTIRYRGLKGNKALQEQIVRTLVRLDFRALIVIGGDGSLHGAHALSNAAEELTKSKELKERFPVVAIPASIDNDIPLTEMSLGVDTAANEIVRCVDKLTDTAHAVNRVSVVETMGRNCGYLPVYGALAAGADDVFSPEIPITNRDVEKLLQTLEKEYEHDRRYAVVVVGEGATKGISPTAYTENYINVGKGEESTWDVRSTVLGHVQRGGPTSAFDRILATRMAAEAVEIATTGLATGDEGGVMVALDQSTIESVPLRDVIADIRDGKTAVKRERLQEIARLVQTLSRQPEDGDTTGALAILTAGEDAQGMNMILRSAARLGRNECEWAPYGFFNGYQGLIENEKLELTWEKLSAAGFHAPRPIRRGGSVLGVTRHVKALTDPEMDRILANLRELEKGHEAGFLKGLIVVGGLRTARRATELDQWLRNRQRIPIVFVPATIDHGLLSSDATVGFDSALNVVVSFCDGMTDTAEARSEVSIVETMGGKVGALTLMGALAAGAELALIGEDVDDEDRVIAEHNVHQALEQLEERVDKFGRDYATILVNEDLYEKYELVNLEGMAKNALSGREVHANKLGLSQRGGNPTFFDRVLGTLMGVKAVRTIASLNLSGNDEEVVAQILHVKGSNIVNDDLESVLEGKLDEDSVAWTEATRRKKAMRWWKYEEMRRLFDQVCFKAPER